MYFTLTPRGRKLIVFYLDRKIIDTHQVKGEDMDKALGYCVQNLDPVTQIAQFPMKFQMGTRKNSVTIKFSMQIKVSSYSLHAVIGNTAIYFLIHFTMQVGQGDNTVVATVESGASNHFVVITNEIQWQGSAGTLLKRDTFEGQVQLIQRNDVLEIIVIIFLNNEICVVQLEVTWPSFANALQRHTLKATKQDPARPIRPLSPYDLKYIKGTFFGTVPLISLIISRFIFIKAFLAL